jgi:predicted PurR-regulated permease PerM
MDRKVFTAILLSVVVVGLVVLAFSLYRPFLLALVWATVLAIVTHQAYETLCRLLRGHRTIAAGIMTALVLLILVGPFLTLTLHFVQDAGSLSEDLKPEALERRLGRVNDHPWVRETTAWLEDVTGKEIDVSAGLAGFYVGRIQPLLPNVTDVLQYLVVLCAEIACVLLALFYLYRDGPVAVRALRELIPLSDADRERLIGDVRTALDAAVRGGLLTALAQGALGGVILFLLGIHRPMLWAAAMALASLVPIIGTAAVWVPMAALLALDGRVGKAAILFGYGALVIGLADNLLRPLLVGRRMEAHPLPLFFGILGGIALFGFAGIVLGPVFVAFLNAATRLFRREFGVRPRRGETASLPPAPVEELEEPVATP